MVRAKFKVNSLKQTEGPNHENTKFWQSSPSGKLELNCVNEAASVQFKLGAEYYVEFTPAK